MTVRMIRKPPLNKTQTERLKIMLMGNHTFKQKVSMLMQAKFHLQHEHGLAFAGPTDVYVPIIDQNGHPLTHFADGSLIVDFNIVIESDYHCAAEDYDRIYAPLAPRPF